MLRYNPVVGDPRLKPSCPMIALIGADRSRAKRQHPMSGEVMGDSSLLLGRVAQLASRGQRRAGPAATEGSIPQPGGAVSSETCFRGEVAGATDGPRSWTGGIRGGPGRTTPSGEAALDAYPATTRCRENGNGYPAGEVARWRATGRVGSGSFGLLLVAR